mgnify:CR=1 FL=1
MCLVLFYKKQNIFQSLKINFNLMSLKNKFIAYISFVFLLFGSNHIISQSTPNPCDFSKINCGEGEKNKLYTSFPEDTIVYAPPGMSMPFWFAFGDSSTGIIDTTGAYSFSLSKVEGPGDIEGVLKTTKGYYSYLNDISFSEVGTYKIEINVGDSSDSLAGRLLFIVPAEENFCGDIRFGECVEGGGNQILAQPKFSSVVPVDEVMPIMVGVVDSSNGFLDSTFFGTIDVNKVSGPGELYGILSMTGGPWFNFNYIQFSEEGFYTIRFFEESLTSYKESLMNVQVVETVSGLITIPLSHLRVYPNPFDDQVVIENKNGLKGLKLLFSNSLGQNVLERNIANSSNKVKINTSELSDGVYFVTLSDQEALKVTTFKIVK